MAWGVQLWAIGRLNVPLSPRDRATILSFCKHFYPSGSIIATSLKATTHASAHLYPVPCPFDGQKRALCTTCDCCITQTLWSLAHCHAHLHLLDAGNVLFRETTATAASGRELLLCCGACAL